MRRMRIALAMTLAALAAALFWAQAARALDEVGRYVFVPDRAGAQVAVIDTRSDSVVRRIPVGNVPHQVVVSPALGLIVASNTADNTISIVDLEGGATRTVTLGAEPEHMALGPDGRLLAVGNIAAGSVSLVDIAEARETARIDGFFSPHNLTFGPAGRRLYVANLGARHVTVVDVALGRIESEIPIASPRSFAAAGKAAEAYQGVVNVTATRDGRYGYAAHGEGNAMAVIDLGAGDTVKTLALGKQPWRAFATADGRYMIVPNNGDRTVSVVATDTNAVVATLPGASDMTGVNTGWFETAAFVISRGEDKAVVLDLVGMRKAGEIPLPGVPETGVTTPDGKKLYVALSGAGKVAVIDTKARRVVKTIDGVGREPWGATMSGALNYCH